MIELRNITKSYRTLNGRNYIFRDLSFTIPPGRNIALIGKNGSGKSTLMRLLGGIDIPDKGQITSNCSISWPVGLSGGFQGSMTGRQNVKFVARIYGAEGAAQQELVRQVEDFAGLGKYFDQPVNTYSSGMRGRLGFGLSLAFDFDYYLVDEAISVGDSHFRRKAVEAFKDKVGRANIVLVTHVMSQVRTFCDMVVLLKDGSLTVYEDIEEGIATYTQD